MTTPWRGDEPVPPCYLPIAEAYAWVELIIDGEGENGLNAWKEVTGKNRSPARVAEIITRVACGVAGNPSGDETAKELEVMRKVLVQLKDPLFLTYIAGKMGAV